MSKLPRVGIIGGGIFGLSCAIHLDKLYDVTVFEQSGQVLSGATYANHNRHHYGFHYPRSAKTAIQCLQSSSEFEEIYSDSIVWDFNNYYCVSKNNSKTTPEDYIAFCDELGLEYHESWPKTGILDRDNIALCLKVREGVYDFPILKKTIEKRLSNTSTIQVAYHSKVIDGNLLENGIKSLHVKNRAEENVYEFDIIINAMYANYNRFCAWYSLPKRLFQFNLQELDIIRLPTLEKRIGVTIQDGPFASILPLGRTDEYLLAHVETSQLIRDVSDNTIPLMNRVGYIESNWQHIKESCSEHIPIIQSAEYVRSIFVDRVVDGTMLDDDSRLTDITDHGNGCWSIFAAKVITSEAVAKKVKAQLEKYS
jgi:hypothetical protein